MKKISKVTIELWMMAAVCLVLTVVAVVQHHTRAPFMIVITAFMLLTTFLSRFRDRRRFKTLHGKGQRRRN